MKWPMNARNLGRQYHLRRTRRQAPRTEPRDGALTGTTTHQLCRLQIARIARRGVPIVALHILANLRE